jgi:hypothetical protein
MPLRLAGADILRDIWSGRSLCLEMKAVACIGLSRNGWADGRERRSWRYDDIIPIFPLLPLYGAVFVEEIDISSRVNSVRE